MSDHPFTAKPGVHYCAICYDMPYAGEHAVTVGDLPVAIYNDDKPHRCPWCHAITDTERKCLTGIVICCRCGKGFTERPWLAQSLPMFGVVCTEEHDPVLPWL